MPSFPLSIGEKSRKVPSTTQPRTEVSWAEPAKLIICGMRPGKGSQVSLAQERIFRAPNSVWSPQT